VLVAFLFPFEVVEGILAVVGGLDCDLEDEVVVVLIVDRTGGGGLGSRSESSDRLAYSEGSGTTDFLEASLAARGTGIEMSNER